MKNKREISRKKIIIFYILAVVFPCLVLGILAVRGIKNDQALVEQEQRKKLLEAGQRVIRETDVCLLLLEDGFKEITDSVQAPQKIIFTDSLLSDFTSRHQLVEGIFYLNPAGETDLLNNRLLFVPDGNVSLIKNTDSRFVKDLAQKGQQYEFMDNDLYKALEYYKGILPTVTEKQSKGEILNAIARVNKKLELYDEAIETYTTILDDYSDVFIQNKIPLGAVALLEKSSLLLEANDTIAALNWILLLMNQLTQPAWGLEYSHYANLLLKAEGIVFNCEGSRNEDTDRILKEIKIIRDTISRAQKYTENLLAFAANSKVVLGNKRPGQESINSRYRIRLNGEPYFFLLLPEKNKGQWGLIINTTHLLTNYICFTILSESKELNFSWQVVTENSESLRQAENIPTDVLSVSVVFPAGLPNWSLVLYPEDSGLIASLINSGEGLFLYIFIFIVVILICGLFFSLQIVNKEIHLSKMKSYFMSTVSHEFKSPLTTIRQMAEMLVHGRVPTRERKQKYYEGILQQGERLSHLINNILDFSKMEEGLKIFRFEKADIVPMIKETIDSFRNNMADKGFQFNFSYPENVPELNYDAEAMGQVLHNLLDNACKYSAESRTIEIEVSVEGKKVVISVRDYGTGIIKAEQQRIFTRFYRVGDELTQGIKGSGIGLTIVKQIIEAHKGEIIVESSPNKGSTFHMKLPVR